MTAFDGKHVGLLAMLATVAGAVVVLRLFDPATSGVFPPCPLLALTGWYCPGCGSLRAFHQLLHGNLRNALAMNPLAVLNLPFLVYGMASYAAFVVRGRYLPRIFLPAAWIRALGAAVLVFGVARNLPMHRFPLLAPGGLLGLR